MKKDQNQTTNVELEKQNQLKEASKPLIEYLKANHNPHCVIVLSSDNIEVLEGVRSINLV